MTLESKNGICAPVAIGGNIPAWEATTAYILDDVVIPLAAVNGHSYICTTAGTSDAAEPVWTLVPDSVQPADGTVEWTENGIDADKVIGMGDWAISGGAAAVIDDTAFCDYYEKFVRGIKTGQDVSFNGNWKSDDTDGQDVIFTAYHSNVDLTDLRFYDGSLGGVRSYSYWAPNQSLVAGGKLPANMPISHIKIMSEPDITTTKTDLQKIAFTGKVQGVMRYNEFT